jgi:mono/diheme cytochrome c family protein
MILRYVAISLILLGARVYAEPLSLSVTEIKKGLAAEIVDIRVIELHESDKEKKNTVTYTGVPLVTLLQYLYPKAWKDFDGEIYFHALDGYLSIVDAQKAREGMAYMAFARADAQPFTVDVKSQQETDVSLAPFYLVWDNLKDPNLLRANSYAWPYQVFQMELVSGAMLQSLLPADATPDVLAGFEAFNNNCLSCHNINGFGGRKFGMDIRQSIKGRSRSELFDWIDNPKAINKFTAMPPLDPGLKGEDRNRVINQLLDFLQAG